MTEEERIGFGKFIDTLIEHDVSTYAIEMALDNMGLFEQDFNECSILNEDPVGDTCKYCTAKYCYCTTVLTKDKSELITIFSDRGGLNPNYRNWNNHRDYRRPVPVNPANQ